MIGVCRQVSGNVGSSPTFRRSVNFSLTKDFFCLNRHFSVMFTAECPSNKISVTNAMTVNTQQERLRADWIESDRSPIPIGARGAFELAAAGDVGGSLCRHLQKSLVGFPERRLLLGVSDSTLRKMTLAGEGPHSEITGGDRRRTPDQRAPSAPAAAFVASGVRSSAGGARANTFRFWPSQTSRVDPARPRRRRICAASRVAKGTAARC